MFRFTGQRHVACVLLQEEVPHAKRRKIDDTE